jgi:tetratricopeptide (TPR) repeat protein
VLTGSVRGGAEQARITVRLIEAETGTQLWTQAYDEPLAIELLPELEERVARDVAAVAAPYGPIFEAELARERRAQHTPELRDCLIEYYDYRRRIDAATHKDALLCFKSVSQRKPQVARAWAGLAMLYLDEFGFRFSRNPAKALAAARAATTKALTLDRDDFQANLALTRLKFFDGDPTFRQSIERTLALRPDSAEALANGGVLLVMSGDAAAGLPLVERAQALSQSLAGTYNYAQAVAHLREGRIEAALAAAQQIDSPNWVVAHITVAAAAGLAGRHDVAEAAARRILELYPDFEAEARSDMQRLRFDDRYQARLIEGLRAAGLRIAD